MKSLKPIFYSAVVLLFLSWIAVSCKKNETPDTSQNNGPIKTDVGTPSGDISTATIGPSGGTINSADGNITVTIPADALSASTAISIQPITNNAPLGIGTGYRLMPEGTTFAQPITLTFHYTQALLGDSIENFLWIVTQASDGTWNAMLKSVVDTINKTVTVQSTHFSDWMLGKFIDLKINPEVSVIKKGETVNLMVFGFAKDLAEEELTPLKPITGDNDLEPLTPIEATNTYFKIQKWELNGVPAPTSGPNGGLVASGRNATYVAPATSPKVNPAIISVKMATKNAKGMPGINYRINSSILILEDNYLKLKIDGKPLAFGEYYTNGNIPQENDSAFVTPSFDKNNLTIVAYLTTSKFNQFYVVVNNPSVGTRSLQSWPTSGKDDLNFVNQDAIYYLVGENYKVDPKDNTCVQDGTVINLSFTLLTMETRTPTKVDLSNIKLTGGFSGKIYENTEECKPAIAHSIEGEFSLEAIK